MTAGIHPETRGACTIDGCSSSVVARRRCNRHYKQWRKSGGVTNPRRTHGASGRKIVEYEIWNRMAREPEGRSPGWSSFEKFRVDIGNRPGRMRLLRKDTSKPFGPDNCFWSSSKVNGQNSRQRMSETKRERVVVDGETLFKCGGECGLFLPASGFYSLPGNVNGIRCRCKPCHQALVVRTRDPKKTRENKRRHESRRRTWKAGTEIIITRNQEFELERLWGAHCLKCGKVKRLTWDHIVPLSRGGSHCATNLQCLCVSCNSRKYANTVDYRSQEQIEWALRLKEIN